MFKLTPLIIKNAIRSRTRLLATLGGCAIAAFIIGFFLSAQFSLSRMINSTASNQNIIVREKDKFCPTASMIPDSEFLRIAEIPGVASVMPEHLVMTTCQSASDVLVMHGIDKSIFLTYGAYKVTDAELASFRDDTSGALVGTKLMGRYGWTVGQNVILTELGDISFTIRGIYTTDGSGDDSMILVGRKYLQETQDLQGISHQALVSLLPGADMDTVIAAIEAMPMSVVLQAEAEKDFLAASLNVLLDLAAMSRIIVFVIIAVVLLAIGNAISMATRDRYKEFAIMKTMGFQPMTILGIVMSEGLLQALSGALIGAIAMYVVITADMVKGISNYGLTLTVSTGAFEFAIAVVVVAIAGFLGSALPAFNAARIDIRSALSKED